MVVVQTEPHIILMAINRFIGRIDIGFSTAVHWLLQLKTRFIVTLIIRLLLEKWVKLLLPSLYFILKSLLRLKEVADYK